LAYHTTSGPVQLAAVRAALEEAPDLVFVHKLLGIAPFLKGRLRHERVVLDLDDVEHVGFIRNLLGPPHYLSKPLGLLHFPALLRGEFQAVRHARLSFVCSSSDARYLNRLLVTDRVEVVPNAVELPDHLPLAESPTILFLGSNAYAPNLAAADRLVERIFPLVRRVIPTAQLLLAGEYPEAIRSFNHPPEGVRFLGFVHDLKALYAETRVVACPIMSGSGTRVKLVEAAGYGRPIVSTRIGAEGLDLVPEKSILLADDDAAMAEALVRVLRDELLATRLAESARGIAVDRYDRGQVMLALITRLDMLMKDSAIR
jgi:glycosyltransferase involved in cell wall biosynthesis